MFISFDVGIVKLVAGEWPTWRSEFSGVGTVSWLVEPVCVSCARVPVNASLVYHQGKQMRLYRQPAGSQCKPISFARDTYKLE